MLRRLMLPALALCALVALEGCGANRLMGPAPTGDAKTPVLGKNEPINNPLRPFAPRLGGDLIPDGGEGAPSDPTYKLPLDGRGGVRDTLWADDQAM